MNDRIFTMEEIKSLVKPIAEKYQVQKIYLFGSYTRGEANIDSEFYKTIMKERLILT